MDETAVQTTFGTKPARKSYNPSRVQRGWDKLDSVTKYLIWMCSWEVFTDGCKDLILNLRAEYIREFYKNGNFETTTERNNKWRAMYERQSKNGGSI